MFCCSTGLINEEELGSDQKPRRVNIEATNEGIYLGEKRLFDLDEEGR